MAGKHKTFRWIILLVVVMAVIIVPFMIWGERVDAWTELFIKETKDRPGLIASVLGGLLASDILFPVPSSIVSTGCGVMLGFAVGSLTSFVGMTISSIFGFLLGRVFGKTAVLRFVGEKDLNDFHDLSDKYGLWAIAAARPIPVLAEVSVLFAGISGMSFERFMVVSTLSNMGISLVYGAIGAYSANINSFLLAFAAAVVLPGLGMLVMRLKKAKS